MKYYKSTHTHYPSHTSLLGPPSSPDVSEQDVHDFFRNAIRTALVVPEEGASSSSSRGSGSNVRRQYLDADPIISVYINRERRFAFLEFKTMEICTACLALDGIDVMGRGKVKVKRPNDYNPALAPSGSPSPPGDGGPSSSAVQLDTSRLGIVSPSVPDGPHKIFIGGMPYHLTESQVLELLSAFGRVRAFHLVKADPAAATSKGYCFVEYGDQTVTQIAVVGLNGMDMGGGKQLSARMASARGNVPPGGGGGGMGAGGAPSPGGDFMSGMGGMMGGGMAAGGAIAIPGAAVPAVVDGVDVDALLNAAMGGGVLPGAGGAPPPPMGMMQQPPPPPGHAMMGMNPMMMMQQPQAQPGMMVPQPPPQVVVTDPLAVANAAASALDAAFGSLGGGAGGGAVPPPQMQAPPPPPPPPPRPPVVAAKSPPTRVLVLLNMVIDEDLATAEDHAALTDEVREEAGKFGKLVSIKIPRHQDGYAPSAIKKVFLEYATPNDAMSAEKELAGRAFGPSVVDVSLHVSIGLLLLLSILLSFRHAFTTAVSARASDILLFML